VGEGYPRGSEWRRWDLHVHTPFSALNNGFGGDFEKYAKNLFREAVSKKIAAIGVTDYFCIEGYKRLRALIRDDGALKDLVGSHAAEHAREILLLPNIEFRSSVVVVHPDGKSGRVNFHAIFSDSIDPETIDEHFLRNLKFTAQSTPGGTDERWSLTIVNLTELGKRLRAQHDEFKKFGDLFVGMMNAVVAHEELTAVLSEQQSRFKDRFLLAVSADDDLSKCSWDSQAHLTRKLFIQKSHMLFSGSPGTRDFGLGKKHASVKDFLREFGKLKPCIHGSDAHSYDTLFEPLQKRYMWIKADPTFQGLRQLLYEPEIRAFVGEEPPELGRTQENATKHMTLVEFARTSLAKTTEKWFSGTIPLNNGLTAIIGNKGSGKSALADILALVGNTTASAHFSFLNQERFLAPKTRLGEMFHADVLWLSGAKKGRDLSENVDATAPELVKYIPQNYLEAICSELKESSDTGFDRELKEVIFSHVTRAGRLGAASLPELIDYLTHERQERVALLTKDLEGVNKTIVEIEGQLTEDYRKSIEAQLIQRQLELNAHDKARPTEIKKPAEDPDAQEAAKGVTAELIALQANLSENEKILVGHNENLEGAALQVAAADRLLVRLDNLERQVGSFYGESARDSEILGLRIEDLATLRIDREPILSLKEAATQKYDASKKELDDSIAGSPANKRKLLADSLAAKKLELDEPNRRYQEYLQQLTEWQSRRADISGTDDKAVSVKGLEARLAALTKLPTQLIERRNDRLKLVRDIFATKKQLLEDYQRLYAPVQEFINEHPVAKQQGLLQFFASISIDGFLDGLLEMIHQGRKGSFQLDEGRERLKTIVLGADVSTVAGLEAFLVLLEENLERDKGDPDQKPVRLQEQLKQGVSVKDAYDFIYGLRYLKPRFELRWQDKPLDQLSPGERGTLLLVFYLLIDKRDVPLIIDQPEENLDNQTIAITLVPAIRYAKDRRQIIIVTHNPNLAVVCDADQIIHAQIDKTDGNKMLYTQGSIENPIITQLIVDVLEGTMPAFDLRDARYEVLERLS